VGLGLFLAALDAYVVVTLLPRMIGDLNLPIDRVERVTPVISGFLLGYIVTMPLLGAVSDAQGRGRVYLVSLVAFALGSAITATSGMASFPSEELAGLTWLVTGRILQGLGGGAMVPVALALVSDLYPPGRRGPAVGTVAALQETGSVLGPLYGALLAAALAGAGGWRAVFWVNLPLAVVCAAAFGAAYRRQPRAEHRPAAGATTRVDWGGGILVGVGLGLLVLALYPDDPERRATGQFFIPALTLSVLAFAAYAWYQRGSASPLLPRALLRQRTFIGASLANVLVGAGLIVALVDIPILAHGVFRLSQLDSALLLARLMLAIPVGAVAGGWLLGRAGHAATAVLGLALAAGGFVLMSGWGADELSRHYGPLPAAATSLALCGFGFGLVIAPLAVAVIDAAGENQHGLAGSLAVLARMVGMLLGLAALTAFGLHRFYEISRQGPQLILVPGSPDLAQQTAAIEARFRESLLIEYHEIFLVAAGICAVAAVVALATLSGRRDARRVTVDR
jgi:MFS family permease